MRRARVIGCGNPHAGDDAAGLLVAAALRDRVPEGVEVVEAGPASRVLDLLDGVDVAIVVDAVRSPGGERAPGTLVRAEAGPDGLPASLRSSLSSHGLGVAEAVALAAALGRAPRVVVHGVEAADVGVGSPPSAPVAAALPRLQAAVLADLRVPADAISCGP
ncbi:MAG: hydrogenase maturation protease [Planctomycetaceae bacterium]